MSYDDRVLALFAEANPVSDDAGLDELMRPGLQLIKQREEAMSEDEMRAIDTDRPIVKQERSRGLLYGAAAAMIALALGTGAWLALAGSAEKTVAEDAADGEPVAVIEAFYKKWSEGDVNGALELVSTKDGTEDNLFLQQTMEYVTAIEPEGWFWSVSDCVEQVPGTYNCRVELVGDPLLATMGVVAGRLQLRVEDGKLTQAPQVFGVDAAQADRRLATYSQKQDPAGYEAVCVGANGRAYEANGVVYDNACGVFLAQYLESLAAELTAP